MADNFVTNTNVPVIRESGENRRGKHARSVPRISGSGQNGPYGFEIFTRRSSDTIDS